MKIEEVIDSVLVGEISDIVVLGIDIGSRNAKAVLLKKGEIFTAIVATGVNMQATSEELLEEIFEKAGMSLQDIKYIVGTGYGRISLKFPDVPTDILTEISCHAMGAHYLNSGTRTIIDIGGQDAKGIQIDPQTGKVIKFKMNDKCAAGTGRFLEKAASLLDLGLSEFGSASLRAEKELDVSSQCVVFAESEVVSLRAKGEASEDIAAGVHFASARRVISLLNQIPLEADLVFTGGVSNNVGMKHALEQLLGHPIIVPRLDMVFAGALGAAIYAQRLAEETTRTRKQELLAHKANLSDLTRKIEEAEVSIIERLDVKKVGYLCTYTPVEILSAADVAYTRLGKCGLPNVVAQGETIVKSVFCDVTKSIIGHFAAKDPLYEALDQVATFYTCDSMRATADAIDNYFKPTIGYVVPRGSEKEAVRNLFRQQIINFKSDIETLTGKPLSVEKVREHINLHKKIRRLIKEISELRKRNNPPISGADFLEITRAYRTIPPEEQVSILSDIHNRLLNIPDDDFPRLRIMIAGGMMADGDRRIMDLLEKDLGVNVVVEDHCTGLSPFYYETEESGDPWQELANSYLDQAPCARQFPLSKRIDFSALLAKEYSVDAVIFTYLKFCPCYGMTKGSFIKKFQDTGIPVLELDTDYSQGDTGQINTRLEAFIEVLKETKGGEKN
ncbi:R-phenyllactate dehydratase activator [Ruminiclostridium hungatei]|uniref:R-phenyllactate dehydratase activator n=1 Tax=Ruminiclostridium hungatei TaxID=48256 RepID=A0A1V4SIL6_RUMHU|nr:2-hydroxyacyl-CoA dehydratase [Ruminiclostridium hungatei]OPX43346.1 R-phenyllactate dehydratase activator [Ruminiclostridium hungatei]